ncbi:hypothetical protein DPMN_092827 [Dreissena polymorpha]|uniref:Uncharacterized protein n=1 Tax=Dreissena polymorpha TaxID=45954 RepID=A0A9D4L2I0_DREPO|nr:hypothetical protein DPMN_092827 [Dreissena polymorpha]
MTEGNTDRRMSETESVPIHSSMYSRHSRNHVESVSVEVCHIMTMLGYGEEIRRRRVEKNREWDILLNPFIDNVTFITAGSKAEGLTCINESDYDFLFVPNNVLCVEAGVDLHTISDDVQDGYTCKPRTLQDVTRETWFLTSKLYKSYY